MRFNEVLRSALEIIGNPIISERRLGCFFPRFLMKYKNQSWKNVVEFGWRSKGALMPRSDGIGKSLLHEVKAQRVRALMPELVSINL